MICDRSLLDRNVQTEYPGQDALSQVSRVLCTEVSGMGMPLPPQLNVFTAEEMCSSKPGQTESRTRVFIKKIKNLFVSHDRPFTQSHVFTNHNYCTSTANLY